MCISTRYLIWLQVAEPEPHGFLIVGADDLARTIAETL